MTVSVYHLKCSQTARRVPTSGCTCENCTAYKVGLNDLFRRGRAISRICATPGCTRSTRSPKTEYCTDCRCSMAMCPNPRRHDQPYCDAHIRAELRALVVLKTPAETAVTTKPVKRRIRVED